MNWISVKDRVPVHKEQKQGKYFTQEALVDCLVFDGEEVFEDAHCLDDGFHESITHWIRISDIPHPK